MDSDLFYTKLKQTLLETTRFPTNYFYKFIVPNDIEKIKEIEKIFNYTGAVISTRDSKKGNFVSVSVKVNMKTPDEIIKKYQEVSKIEGVMSL